MFFSIFFFFNDTATTEIYTLSLHDALPISHDGTDVLGVHVPYPRGIAPRQRSGVGARKRRVPGIRSEEHTSELQSLAYLVCRLLLEKKKITAGETLHCRLRRALPPPPYQPG